MNEKLEEEVETGVKKTSRPAKRKSIEERRRRGNDKKIASPPHSRSRLKIKIKNIRNFPFLDSGAILTKRTSNINKI